MLALVATNSKCRERTQELVLAEEPEEITPPYVPLFPLMPPVPSSASSPQMLDGEA
jgi:hypothetical protein